MTSIERPIATGRRRHVLFVLVAGLCIASDRATKWLAFEELRWREPMSFLGDTVRIVYAENRGAFLGWGADWPPLMRFCVLGLGAGSVLVWIGWRVLRGEEQRLWAQVAFSMLVGGGVANLIDRIIRGSVIDFMNMGIGALRTGIFNVADVAISAGVVMLFFGSFSKDKPSERPDGPEEPAPTSG